jgi:ketosteroid isomerase-like protein
MMRNKLLVVPVCLLVLLAGCKRQAAVNRDQERQNVLQAYAQLKEVWNKGDLAGLDAVFRPDAIFIDAQNPGKPEHWGGVRLDVQRSAQLIHPVLTDAGQPVVNISADGTAAWLATKYHVKAAAPQGVIEANGILTLCFLKDKEKGAYRVVLFHASRVP